MLALVISFAGFSPALAAPPNNDDFANAEAISTLPFSTVVDITEATQEASDPQICASLAKSVWYTFSPNENTLVTTVIQENIGFSVVNIFRGSGVSNLTFMTCQGNNSPYTFLATAGETYYFQIGTIPGFSGDIQVSLNQVPAPANDLFANAIDFGAAPGLADFEISGATLEDNEPSPSCMFGSPFFESVWYSFTPAETASLWAILSPAPFSPVMAVYSGTTLSTLTELGCGGSNQLITLHVESGQTYYFQIGSFFPELGKGSFQLTFPQPPIAGMFFFPSNPSVFDTLQFFDQSFDPGQAGFQSFTWDFGDGTTSTETNPNHKYAADGDYTIEHSATTTDGRIASTSQAIQVRTHDVSATKIETSNSSREGKNETITVTVTNSTAYTESVRVDLYKSVAGGGYEFIGTITQTIPASTKNDKDVKFIFQHRFTSSDAAVGKVVFRVVVGIENSNDAFPQDNERTSQVIQVKTKK